MMKHLFTVNDPFYWISQGTRMRLLLLVCSGLLLSTSLAAKNPNLAEENIPCDPIVIENINVTHQVECGVGDGTASILISDANSLRSSSSYRVELHRPGLNGNLVDSKPPIVIDHNIEGGELTGNEWTIKGIFPGTYMIKIVRTKEDGACTSGTQEITINTACIDLDIRSPENCGSDKVTYTNCEGFTVHIPRELLEADAYFFVDDDFTGCMAYVNEDCEIQPSTRVYCADYILDVPFWLYTFQDDDPNDNIPTVTLIHKYLREDIGFTDLEAARTNYAMCNAGDDYTPAEINDAIWGILGQLNDFEIPCNTLCSAAKQAVGEDVDVAGAVGTLTYYKSLDPNKQDFVQQVAEADCIDCFPKKIECFSKIDSEEFTEGCTRTACEGTTLVLDPRRLGGDEGTWEWRGPNGFTSNSRQAVLSNVVPEMSGEYVVTFREDDDCFGGAEFAVMVFVMPEPNVDAETQNATCGENNGSITFTFPDDPLQTNIEFSVDGGETYPINVPDNQETASFDNLPPGTYETLARWGNDACPINLGSFVIEDVPGPTLNFIDDFIICPGDSSLLTVEVVGGTAPFQYMWTLGDIGPREGSSTLIIKPTEPTTYTVIVTDANGCEAIGEVNVDFPEVLLESNATVARNVSCTGFTDGSVEVIAQGGQPPYQYEWNTGLQMPILENVGPGEYTVTVTDNMGCKSVSSVIINEPETLSVAITSQTPVLCKGESTGSAKATASGGTAPYAFTWSNEDKGDVISEIPAGSYTVTVVDAGGCSATASVEIAEPETALTANIVDQTMVTCATNVGSATVEGSGSTPPYTYEWSNGETMATAVQLPAGSHTVTVTDVNGCKAETSVTILTMDGLEIEIMEIVDVKCANEMTGSITVRGRGGMTPYLYTWSNGASGPAIINLSPGEYCVTLTDAGGCTAETCVTIGGASLITMVTEKIDVTCGGDSDGQIDLTISGGTPPYDILWNNGATTEDLNNLPGGDYMVQITDANGCTAETSVTINEPEMLVAMITSNTGASCAEMGNSLVVVTATGGTGSYTYLWSNGNTTDTLSNVPSGDYTVTVTDTNGCTATASAQVSNPSTLDITTIVDRNVDCEGANTGLARVEVSGGTPPYTYAWSNDVNTGINEALVAGTYSVTVTDANGCESTGEVIISEPTAMAIDLSSSVNVSCAGEADGTAIVQIEGGTAPYSFEWNNGSTSDTLMNLGPDIYAVTATDANGCTIVGNLVIEQPEPMAINLASGSDAVCSGQATGNVMVDAMGGTAPYSYIWSNGINGPSGSDLEAGEYIITATDSKGCTAVRNVIIGETAAIKIQIDTIINLSCGEINTGSIAVSGTGGAEPYNYAWSTGDTTAVIDSLVAGEYTVTVTDINGCDADTLVAVISTGEGLVAEITESINVDCTGNATGSATVTVVEAGTEPYSYAWSNGVMEATVTGMLAGQYTVTVTDANGCESIDSIFITEPDEAMAFAISSKIDVLCKGEATGSAVIETRGGTPPYTYLWQNGETTPSLDGLPAGTYLVTVTDANGCVVNPMVEINEPELALGVESIEVTNISCPGDSDGAISSVSIGGTPPYTVAWSNGATTSSISDLPAGTYSFTITDANGCTYNDEATVTEPTPIEIEVAASSLSCVGETDGSIDITVTGGSGNYTYLWSFGATEEDLSLLVPGDYGVTVTDENGCTASAMATIEGPQDELELRKIWYDIVENCQGEKVGVAMAKPKGGTPPYSYEWTLDSTFLSTEASIFDMVAGNYYVTVTDANGCEDVGHLCLVIPERYYVGGTIGADQVLCGEFNDPERIIGEQGFTYADPSQVDYVWMKSTSHCVNESVSSSSLKWTAISGAHGESYDPGPISQTTYFMRYAKYDGDVEASNIVKVDYLEAPVVNMGYNRYICEGEETTINVSAYGGAGDFTFNWSHEMGNGTSQTVNPTESTIYTVTVTDAMGCQVVDHVEVTTRPGPNLEIQTAGGYTGPFCIDEALNLEADARGNTLSAIWATDGDGTFTITDGLTTTYNFGTQDVANGSVKIMATTAGYIGSCQAITKEVVITTASVDGLDCVSGLLGTEDVGGSTNEGNAVGNSNNGKEGSSQSGTGTVESESKDESQSTESTTLEQSQGEYTLQLFQNRPNPFMTDTKIEFEIPKPDRVEFVVKDMAGKTLKTITNNYEAGRHEITLVRGSLPYGFHFYSIRVGGEIVIRKMLILE